MYSKAGSEVKAGSDILTKTYTDRLNKLLIPDPWSTPGFEKRDLYRVYLTDSILETARIDPSFPEYEELVDLIATTLKKATLKDYNNLQDRLFAVNPKAFNNVTPSPLTKPKICPADPRVVDTVDECLNWLAYRAKE